MQAKHPSPSLIGHLILISFAFFAISISIIFSCGFNIEFDGFLIAIRILFVLSGAAYLLRNNKFTRKLSWIVAGIVAYTLISAGGVLLAFSAAITSWPLQDRLMMRLDGVLGYDWHVYGEFISDHPILKAVFKFCYFSIDWQPIIIILVLSFREQHLRMVDYITSTILALTITMLIFIIVPVTTAWSHGTLNDIADAARFGMNDSWVSELERLRHGELRTIRWGIIGAVVGFPSVHCITALINSWHLWRDRGFRLVGIPLNVALIASSPIYGGHYLADLVAGGAIAAVSIVLSQWANRLHFRKHQLPVIDPLASNSGLKLA